MDLERSLKIDNSNYRSCRRLVADWTNIDKQDQRLVVTRLLQAYRARMHNSDLYTDLQRLAVHKDLELKGVNQTEPLDKEEILKQAVLFSKKTGMDLQAALFLALKGKLP